MEESFSLPVSYKGEDIEVPVVLRVTGYSPRFIAMVNGIEITIEKDEEGRYRAIQSNSETHPIDKELLSAVVDNIESIFT